MPLDDNDPAMRDTTASTDTHGQAALLLVESLIHGLCENSTLHTRDAIEIAERAVSVQLDKAEAADDPRAPMWESHALLMSIVASLRTDTPDHPATPELVP